MIGRVSVAVTQCATLIASQGSDAACAIFESRDRAERRKIPAKGAETVYVEALAVSDEHRAWLVRARGGLGCPCGGRLHEPPFPGPADTCLVCCDLLAAPGAGALLRCAHCDVFFHTSCADGWCASRLQSGMPATCAHCRAVWRVDSPRKMQRLGSRAADAACQVKAIDDPSLLTPQSDSEPL